MNSFSAFTYIRLNFRRVIAIAIVIAAVATTYIGGIYAFNISDVMEATYAYQKDFVLVLPSTESADHNDFQQARHFAEEQDGVFEVLQIDTTESISFRSVMEFDIEAVSFRFRTPEDFALFSEATGFFPEGLTLEDGQIVISDLLARNLGVDIGDMISSDHETVYFLHSEYEIAGIFQAQAMLAYSVYYPQNGNGYLCLRQDTGDIRKDRDALLASFVDFDDIHPRMTTRTYLDNMRQLEEEMAVFFLLYFAVVGIISLVIAIAAYSIFSGVFEKRKYEFSVYNALGISRKRIILKMISDVMIIDVFGLIIGLAIALVALLVLNEWVLYAKGQFLDYFHPISLVTALICNVIVIIPIILSQSLRIMRYDVTRF